MDPWFSGLLGALGASLVWATVLVARDRAVASPRRRFRKAEASSNAADLVPLVFAPVNALREIVDAALPEIKSLFSPGGEVAIVFSDVADSTRLNERLGDHAWAELLRTHDEAVRGIVRANGGRVVKRQGDGFMAAFHDAESATRAALDFQPAVGRALKGAAVSLELRVGVHFGEVVSQRGDYFGTNVVTAARVAATARPGTVLITDAVAQALGEGSGMQAHRLRRPTRLRGLADREQLHRAVND